MEHIITPGLEVFEDRWHFSISKQPAAQFDQAFVHLRQYLEAAGASLGDVIEMTSYARSGEWHRVVSPRLPRLRGLGAGASR